MMSPSHFSPRLEAPVLMGERIRLRPHLSTDLVALLDLWTRPAIVKHTVGTPLERAEVWRRLVFHKGCWATLGYGYWVIEDTSSCKLVGEAGLQEAYRDMFPELVGLPEMGWCVHPDFWGRGFASQAIDLILNWADEHMPCKIAAVIHEKNEASSHLAEKFGFERHHRSVLNKNVNDVYFRSARQAI